LPAGNFTKLYLLAASTEDTNANFNVDGQTKTLNIQKWTGFIGQFYNRILSKNQDSVLIMQKPYVKTDNIAWFASHVHNQSPSKNQAYQYSYLYKYEIEIPLGSKTLTLPMNEKVRLIAMTIAKPSAENVTPLLPLYDNFDGNKEFKLRIK
jgi:alpha-mannosidase